MAILTLEETKLYLQIPATETKYDAVINLYIPAVEAGLNDICNRTMSEIPEEQLIGYKPVFARMIMWQILRNKPEQIGRGKVRSRSDGMLYVMYDSIAERYGYPTDMIRGIQKIMRPVIV